MGLEPNTGKNETDLTTEEPGATELLFPHHVIRLVVQVLVVFAILATLTTFWPAPMGEIADPTKAPGNIEPEWAFLAAHHVLEIVKLIPAAPLLQQTLGVSIVFAGFLFILLVPYIDRREERRPRKRPFAMVVLLLAILAYVALTLWPQWTRYLL